LHVYSRHLQTVMIMWTKRR